MPDYEGKLDKQVINWNKFELLCFFCTTVQFERLCYLRMSSQAFSLIGLFAHIAAIASFTYLLVVKGDNKGFYGSVVGLSVAGLCKHFESIFHNFLLVFSFLLFSYIYHRLGIGEKRCRT